MMPPRFALVATLAMLLCAPLAAAHVTHAAGAYTLRMGWGVEPPAAGARNGVGLAVLKTDTQQGVAGLADALALTVKFGGQTKTLALAESDELPGNYTAPIEPTQPGVYTFHVEGKVAGQAVSEDFVLEEVADGSADQFPPAKYTLDKVGGDVDQLKQEVAALQAKAGTQSATPATVTPQTSPTKPAPGLDALALLGLVALAALVAGRRR